MRGWQGGRGCFSFQESTGPVKGKDGSSALRSGRPDADFLDYIYTLKQKSTNFCQVGHEVNTFFISTLVKSINQGDYSFKRVDS